MIKLTLVLYLFFSAKIFAIDISVLDEQYPGFHDFEATCFSPIRMYLRTLLSRSVIVGHHTTAYNLELKGINSESIIDFRVAIDRSIERNKIVENVNYYFGNGHAFNYIVTRIGDNLSPIPDIELMSFQFSTSDKLKSYSLRIPEFGVDFHRDIGEFLEESYFIFSAINMKIFINTSVANNEVSRNYTFSYRKLNKSQMNLNVLVVESADFWPMIDYVHFLPDVGMIDPKKFYELLGDLNNIFVKSGAEFLDIMHNNGFPKII